MIAQFVIGPYEQSEVQKIDLGGSQGAAFIALCQGHTNAEIADLLEKHPEFTYQQDYDHPGDPMYAMNLFFPDLSVVQVSNWEEDDEKAGFTLGFGHQTKPDPPRTREELDKAIDEFRAEMGL